ncbi:MAG: anti-sigma factor [Actinobacteria bacterium]|nr:MAG: anti-sigma factor [Actinomycetota bacterium]
MVDVPGTDDRELDGLALEALAEAYATSPPSALRDRMLGAARQETALQRALRARGAWRLVGVVAAGTALVLGGLVARESRLASERGAELAALAAKNAELGTQVERQSHQLARLEAALDSQAHVISVMGAPRTVTAALVPREGVTGRARVLVDAASGEAAIVASGLDPAPPGQTYEVWAIRGQGPPEPAGLFTVSAEHAVAARIASVKNPAGVTAFAVSIEPAGGSATPTGPIVLVGGTVS